MTYRSLSEMLNISSRIDIFHDRSFGAGLLNLKINNMIITTKDVKDAIDYFYQTKSDNTYGDLSAMSSDDRYYLKKLISYIEIQMTLSGE